MTETLAHILQLLVGISIINVWLFRKNKATPWRAGQARDLHEEFETYGLPKIAMTLVGTFKVAMAVALIAGIWIPSLTKFAAAGLAITLLAAVVAHIKVQDPPRKSVPAATLLAITASLFLL